MPFEPVEELRVDDQPVLDDLRKPGPELPVGERVEGVGIGDDGDGLVEGADHVLAERVVDAGLAADRGVHLGEQRRRQLHEVDAALVARRGEARHVADDAAAEGDDGAAPVEPLAEQRLVDPFERLEVLVRLALGEDDVRRGHVAEPPERALEVKRGDALVGDDHRAPGDVIGEQLAPPEQALTDVDRVAAVAEVDAQGVHGQSIGSPTSSCFLRWRRMRATTWYMRRESVEISTSASAR